MGAPVERRAIGDGLSVARLVTGLWQIADMERDAGEVDREAAAAAMDAYVDAGLTTFDMADHYGSAELIAGSFAAAHPGTAELLTKWVPPPGPTDAAHVRAAVERALERLRVDRLDLLQYHAWSYADPSYLDALGSLEELRQEGLIAHIGLTNMDTAHLGLILHSGIRVATNQVSYSLLDARAAIGMSALCQRHGVGLLAFGTLAGGFLTEAWLGADEPDPDALRTWSQMKYARYIREVGGWKPFQALLRVVAEIASRHDVSMANVACRAILDDPAVTAVIVGARLGASEHVEANLRTFAFELDDEDRALLAEARAAMAPIPGDCGDEYRRPPFLTAAGDLSDHLEALPPPYPAATGPDGRTRVLTGTLWEDLAGFSRAVRDGDRIVISGTTATHGDRAIGGDDPAAQTHFVIDKIEGALQSLGARLEDVIRTRVYLRNADDWEPVSRAHGARFRHVQPANTLLQAGIIGSEYRVEIEAEAIVGSLRAPA